MTGSDLENYLAQIESQLQELEPDCRAELILELRTHVEDSMADRPGQDVLAHMGSPNKVGKALAKANRSHLKDKKLWVVAPVATLIIIVSLAPILARGSKPQHCVSSPIAANTNMAQAQSTACFDNFADAISYATGGAVSLPQSASPDEVSAALRQYYAGNPR
jgi:hypothetical protein